MSDIDARAPTAWISEQRGELDNEHLWLTSGTLNRKINKSPTTCEDPAILKLHLTKPPVKRIDLHFPLGMEVTARNMKGVTIKDALDAIHKAFKKRVCPSPLGDDDQIADVLARVRRVASWPDPS